MSKPTESAQKRVRQTEIQWPEWDRKKDPELYDYYAEAMLEPGWAGELTTPQWEYIRDQLLKKRSLRTAWGFIHGTGRINRAKVEHVAKHGRAER